MRPGDCLFVYTDGVTEAMNAEGELYGETRLVAAVNQDPDAEPDEVLRMVQEDVKSFVQDAFSVNDPINGKARNIRVLGHKGRAAADHYDSAAAPYFFN